MRWAPVQRDDLREGSGRYAVVLGDRMEAADVAVDGSDRRWTVAVHHGQREIGSRGELAGLVRRLQGGGEEAPGKALLGARAQAVAQRDGLRGRDGQALSVERVEGRDGVADDEQPGREAGEAVVAPAAAGREAVGGDVIERLGLAERGGDIRWPDGREELAEAGLIARRAVCCAVAGEREDPLVSLKDVGMSRVLRCGLLLAVAGGSGC